MNQSDRTNEIGAALAALVGKLANPPKKSSAKIPTKKGGEFSYTYLNLPDLLNAVRTPLHECGLAVLQGVEPLPGGRFVGITTRIIHLSGQWIEAGPLPVPASEDPKAVGSACTYGFRYSLAGMLGIAGAEDDDGASATSSPLPPASTGSSEGQSRTTQGGGKADAEDHGGSRMGKARAAEAVTGEAGETPALPLPITEEQKATLREFGARKALEGARELYQTDDRKIPNIGVLTADEAWELIQGLRGGGGE
jgi:hypothetical protein